MNRLPCLLLLVPWGFLSAVEPSDPNFVGSIYHSGRPAFESGLRNVQPPFKNQIQTQNKSPLEFSEKPRSVNPGRIIHESRAFGRMPMMRPLPLPASKTPTISSRQSHDTREPYFVIQGMPFANNRRKANKRLVLALPKDNIQILKAEQLPVVGTGGHGNQFSNSLTLSFRDVRPKSQTGDRYQNNHWNNNNGYYVPSNSKSHSSQVPAPSYFFNERNRQKSRNPRVQYEFIPLSQIADHLEEDEDSDSSLNRHRHHESYQKPDERPDVYEEYEDLISSSGGHVTFVKAQKSSPKLLQAQKASGQSLESMRAIFINPEKIKSKRLTVMQTDSQKIMPMMATIVKASNSEPMRATFMKANTQTIQLKPVTIAKSKTHRQDKSQKAGSSKVQVLAMESQIESEESRNTGQRLLQLEPNNDLLPIDLQCGGNNDLGWCDLGQHYPSSEVSQIIDACEELVRRMYVETPSAAEILEDVASYSLSHNITDHFSKRGDRSWVWDGRPTPFQGTLCDVTRNFIRPSFAQDVKGKWHVIIQTEKFVQKIHLEVCQNPGDPCSSAAVCSKQSQCVQKYAYQHLMSFDPESSETCPFIRLYKFPTACVCRVKQQ